MRAARTPGCADERGSDFSQGLDPETVFLMPAVHLSPLGTAAVEALDVAGCIASLRRGFDLPEFCKGADPVVGAERPEGGAHVDLNRVLRQVQCPGDFLV